MLLKRRGSVVARDTLIHELRASQTLIERCLAQLETAGLVIREEDGAARYAPAPGLAEICDRLEVEANSRPVMVRDEIVSASVDNLQNFADAFRFKKDPPKKDGDA